MRNACDETRLRPDRLSLFVALFACGIALFSARPYAGSWNDGSRLAAVESLVDYHTWAIDQSIFVRGISNSSAASPYPATDPALRMFGTQDKMWINGHFYSDKTPVPSLYLALIYRAIKFAGGLTARDQPNWFCYWMTLAGSGMAYVISVYAIDRLGSLHGLARSARILLTASSALGTVALPYARQLNSHILLLAVCSVLFLIISRTRNFSTGELVVVGSLAGAGYTLDFVIGSILVLGIVALTIARSRAWAPPLLILSAAFPWFLLHHALNYMIGGTFLPANANPEYFQWPGCPFTVELLTGGWRHHGAYEFVGYALDLLVGGRGFLGHNLPLLLALAGAVWLLGRAIAEKKNVWFAIGFSISSWLVYAASSTNHGGVCCSVRWFVPLLAPGYYVLVLLLHYDSRAETDLRILSIGSFILGGFMWWQGPWMPHMIPGYWFIVVMTCLAWIFYRIQRLRAASRKS
jgi:hypothetical protein